VMMRARFCVQTVQTWWAFQFGVSFKSDEALASIRLYCSYRPEPVYQVRIANHESGKKMIVISNFPQHGPESFCHGRPGPIVFHA